VNTIQSGWESFERDTVNPEVSPVQRHETKAAFYGGVVWMMKLLVSYNGSDSEDVLLEVLKGVHSEATDFANRGVYESLAAALASKTKGICNG
jgi:hypothetical protein